MNSTDALLVAILVVLAAIFFEIGFVATAFEDKLTAPVAQPVLAPKPGFTFQISGASNGISR